MTSVFAVEQCLRRGLGLGPNALGERGKAKGEGEGREDKYQPPERRQKNEGNHPLVRSCIMGRNRNSVAAFG